VSDFKRDIECSDKRFAFVLPSKCANDKSVAVFESPIDVLSHLSINPDYGGWRLSLGGTAIPALKHFLELLSKRS
jgi:hypothetical protein